MSTPEQSAAFVALWSAHGTRVYSYIYTIVGNWTDADDVYQETSIQLFQKFDAFTPGTNFLAWACQFAHFKSLQCLRNRVNALPVNEQLFDAIGAEQLSLLETSDARLTALAECQKKLPASDRKLLKLRYQVGGEIKTIAAATGRSANVIYKSLSRIHKSLFLCIRQTLAENERS